MENIIKRKEKFVGYRYVLRHIGVVHTITEGIVEGKNSRKNKGWHVRCRKYTELKRSTRIDEAGRLLKSSVD